MEGMCLICGRQSFKRLARLCETVQTEQRNLSESVLQVRFAQVADLSQVVCASEVSRKSTACLNTDTSRNCFLSLPTLGSQFFFFFFFFFFFLFFFQILFLLFPLLLEISYSSPGKFSSISSFSCFGNLFFPCLVAGTGPRASCVVDCAVSSSTWCHAAELQWSCVESWLR